MNYKEASQALQEYLAEVSTPLSTPTAGGRTIIDGLVELVKQKADEGVLKGAYYVFDSLDKGISPEEIVKRLKYALEESNENKLG